MPLESQADSDDAQATLWIDPEFAGALARAGLNRFAAFISTDQGRLFRTLETRESRRLELRTDDGRLFGAWLKRHAPPRPAGLWQRLRGATPTLSDGRLEAMNAELLARDSIAALRPIACGERKEGNRIGESFVLTEELAGYTQLDHFIDRRFSTLAERGTTRDHALDTLLDAVADLARKFHAAGYNHRDFYCCHFFVAEPRPGEFDVKLIDLQRVEHRLRRRTRWVLKDLAQLSYSASRARISTTQRMRFLRRYLQVAKLNDGNKRFLRLVLLKHAQMEWRLGVHA